MVYRLHYEPSGPLGLIESLLDTDKGVVVVATFDQPRARDEIIVRCMNFSAEPQEVRTETMIGVYRLKE